MKSCALILAAGIAVAGLVGGCVQVKEPLVKFDASGLGGGSRPDTQVKSTDSDETRALKERVVRRMLWGGECQYTVARLFR